MVDTTVQNRINILEAEVARINNEISAATAKKEGTASLYKKITSNGEEFASFLVENSILQYNIHKKEYLQKLINEEVGFIAATVIHCGWIALSPAPAKSRQDKGIMASQLCNNF